MADLAGVKLAIALLVLIGIVFFIIILSALFARRKKHGTSPRHDNGR